MSGILDWFESLKGEVNEKSRNPFFATFIFVWTIRHWEAVYSFFFFGDEFNLDQRIERFNHYFEDYTFLTLLGTIGITFVVILLGYVLSNFTRLISNIFENLITPWIFKWTSEKGTIVTRETYNNALIQEKRAREKLEVEIERRIKLQIQLDEAEQKNQSSLEHLEESKVKEVEPPLFVGNEDELNTLKAEEYIKSLDITEIRKTVHLLGLISEKKQVTEIHPLVRKLERQRMIDFKSEGKDGDAFYKITPLGLRLMELLAGRL